MALGSFDERDLLLPLFWGVGETPLWETFLLRLLARTAARRICLLVRPAAVAGAPPIQRMVAAHSAAQDSPFDIEALSKAGVLPYATLRPHRVYSLEETIIPDSAETVAHQREVLEQSHVAYARFIRIVARGDHNAWLILLHDRQDFEAADSALLSAVAPHLALALTMAMELNTLRLRATIAEEALALIGVGQAAFDGEGRAIIADAIATTELELQANGRPNLRAAAAHALHTACAEIGHGPARSQRLVPVDTIGSPDDALHPGDNPSRSMLMRPMSVDAGAMPSGASAIGLVRQPARENATSAARVTAATLGLSTREGALAEAISHGRTIVEAGAALQLTEETARNYSKRIYAKTGASGQADLVRLVLTGLSPFA